MPEARRLTFTPAAGRPLVLAAALTGEPLLVAIERPEGKLLVLTVNLERGDLPLRTAFPILATNALAWFAGGRGELHEALATGAVTEVTLPENPADSFVLRAPDGQTRPLPPGVKRATVGPLDQCGVWAVVLQTPGAMPAAEIACNLANRAESDLRPPESLSSSGDEATAAAAIVGRPVWFFLLAVAWLLVVFEWYLYQRRWIT
jgi:hypothetical protein